ncbi:MAG: murein hydrolase activator EnvC family protein [Actinomycetota bacterium]
MRRFSIVVTLACALVGVSAVPSSLAGEPPKLQRELDAAAAQYGRLETQLAETEARRRKLEADLKQADTIISQRSALMKVRASNFYKQGGVSTYLSDLLMAENFGVFFKRLYYLEILGREDSELIDGLRVTQSRADQIFEDLATTKTRQTQLVEQQKDKKRQLEAKLKGAKSAAKVSRIRAFNAFTLPIGGPQGFANTWGARRSGGRRHKGTDVMASCGAPVVAVTDGVVSLMRSGGLGGISAYLRASNGDVFYYAHLRGYAPGIRVGSRVSAGQKIGVNGNTGNARGGPCHVHFEWHKGGGGPVNPYPLLAAAR